MKSITNLLVIVFTALTLAEGSEPNLGSLRETLLEVTTRHYNAAKIEIQPDSFTVSQNTMVYQVHSVNKTGEISETSHDEVGPKVDGFIITITRRTGVDKSAARYPQTFSRPYWKTFGTVISSNQDHFHVAFSYGRKIPDDFVSEIISAIEQK